MTHNTRVILRSDAVRCVEKNLLGGGSLAGVTTLTAFLARSLETRSDGFGLGTAATRPATTLLVVFTRGLGATVGAVRVGAFLLFLFLTDRRFTTRFDNRVGDGLRDQLDGANRVVVAGDRNRDQIGIGVRVDDRDDRDVELVRFADADALLLRIDDEHEAREAAHVANTVQVLRELLALAAEHELLFLGVVLEFTAFLAARLELLHAADLLLHRLVVGEQTAQPTLGDEEGAGTLGLSADDARELRLGADEEDVFATQNDFARELLSELDLTQGLLEVDDVDPVALREDEAAHLGIPAAGLVPEVDARGEKRLERRSVGTALLVGHADSLLGLSVGSPSVSVSDRRIFRHRNTDSGEPVRFDVLGLWSLVLAVH